MKLDSNVDSLGCLMNLESGFAFKSSDWVEVGTPVIKIRNVQDGYVDLSGCSFVSQQTAAKASEWFGQVGNTLIALTGAGVGEIGRIHDNQTGLINQRVGWVRAKDSCDEDYIYYLLRYFKNKIIDLATGSAQPNVSPRDILRISCRVPEKSQRVIVGSFLTVIDKKIEFNDLQTKTLENIAQAIFKSWFVDFDPVKAKMAGETPVGMNDATAALFPDSMEDSELGPIPKGWSKGLLRDLAQVSYGAPFGSKSFNSVGDGVPLIRIRDLKTQSIATWTTEIHTKGFLTEAGALLIGMDGEFNPTLWFGPDSWVNQRICRIEGKSSTNSMYLYFSLLPIMKRIEHGSTGSTVIHLGKTDLDAIEVLNPCEDILARYRDLTEPMLQALGNLAATNRVLIELRDSLLPRLISGELQIPEEMLVS
jgi:type I restriction enzyme S subunit